LQSSNKKMQYVG